VVEELISNFVETGKFTAQEISISADSTGDWVQFRSNPQRFLPSIFDGNWAWPDRKPSAGMIKVVRVMAGNDGVYRLIGRQGSGIFATPWIGE
jgi:hypothetical protein